MFCWVHEREEVLWEMIYLVGRDFYCRDWRWTNVFLLLFDSHPALIPDPTRCACILVFFGIINCIKKNL